jgi:hypothetical protein
MLAERMEEKRKEDFLAELVPFFQFDMLESFRVDSPWKYVFL